MGIRIAGFHGGDGKGCNCCGGGHDCPPCANVPDTLTLNITDGSSPADVYGNPATLTWGVVGGVGAWRSGCLDMNTVPASRIIWVFDCDRLNGRLQRNLFGGTDCSGNGAACFIEGLTLTCSPFQATITINANFSTCISGDLFFHPESVTFTVTP